MTHRNRRHTIGLAFALAFGFIFVAIASGATGFVLGQALATPVATGPMATVEPADSAPTVVTVIVTQPASPVPTATDAPEPPTPTPIPTAIVVAPEIVSPAGPTTFTPDDLITLWEAWALIEAEFDGEVPGGQAMGEAVTAFAVDSLDDPFTTYLPPALAAELRESRSGDFEGIGAIVNEDEEGRIVIVRPIDGQPADLAGLLAGDILIAVDGVSVVGRGVGEVVSLVRGPDGTPVTITVERPGEPQPLDFTIIRAVIALPALEWEMRPDNIAYVRLYTFAQVNVAPQFIEAVDSLLAQDPRGLILDLRDNRGGFLDQTLQIGDYLLPAGVLLQERNRRGLEIVYPTITGQNGETIPLVVLVNEASASASELLAGAIQDRDRGSIVGVTTFGKGSVQSLLMLSDGSELRLTTSRWFTPDDHSVDGVGITPDVVVATPPDLGGPDDTQLAMAVTILLSRP